MTDGVGWDQFGNSVSISRDYAIVSADRKNNYTGAVYIYRRKDTTWIDEYKITPSDAVQNDWFGYSVAISDDNAIVGAVWDVDNGYQSGSSYIYSNFITTNAETELSQIPSYYILGQNYPNPFNPSTTIEYQVPGLSFVSLKVYDVLGNEIATLVNDEKPAGNYEIQWNASELPSGVYLYKLRAADFIETKKMLLMK